jgi:hypothetical protein
MKKTPRSKNFFITTESGYVKVRAKSFRMAINMFEEYYTKWLEVYVNFTDIPNESRRFIDRLNKHPENEETVSAYGMKRCSPKRI